MGIEDTKAVAREWVRRWNLNDARAIGELYSDKEFSWRISGLSPVSAKYDKGQAVELITKTFAMKMKAPFYLEITSMTAEEDRVSFEAVGSAEFLNGVKLENYYHFLMTIRDGKIVRGRAYLDTYTAAHTPLQKNLEGSTP